jgi:hypothetical protein
LHDFLASGEKLATENRRHTKDLRRIQQSLQELREQVQAIDDHLSVEVVDLPQASASGEEEDEGEEEEGYYPAWEVDMMRQSHELEQRQWEDVFVSALEAVIALIERNQTTHATLLQMVPAESGGISLRQAAASIAQEHQESAQRLREQLLAHLSDLRLELINPRPGEPFEEEVHRCVETLPAVPPYKPHQIAKVVSIGYQRQAEVARKADVCVYE